MRGDRLFFWSILFEVLIIIHTILVLWYFKLYNEGIFFGILGGCVITMRYLSHIRRVDCVSHRHRRRFAADDTP